MHDCDAENIPPEDSHMQSPLYSPFVHRKSYSEITQRFADDDIPTLHDHDFFREVDSDDDCDDDLNHSIQSGDTSHEYDADTDYDEMKFSTSTPAAVPTNLSDSTIQKADVKL